MSKTMKKLTLLIVVSIFTFSLTSCSSDDDNDSGDGFVGTAWFGTDNDEGEVYSISTSTNYTFSGDGPTVQGTYTFDGANGIFTDPDYGDFNFTVVNDVMTVDDGSMSVYIKQ